MSSHPFHDRPFRSHRMIRGGDLQTLIAPFEKVDPSFPGDATFVDVSLGDQVAVHRNAPELATHRAEILDGNGRSPKANILLVHGISGCHAASYMIRMAKRFLADGFQTFRMDMRGCGSVADQSSNVSHAGRSDDVAAGIQAIHRFDPDRPIFVLGISLGGNQSLRLMGRIGSGIQDRPLWHDQIAGVVAIAPPADLMRCSENMQRLRNRFYNHYFIRSLIRRVPARVRERVEFQAAMTGPPMRTLRDLDDRLTAPLSGFRDAETYYRQASSYPTLGQIDVPTLILTADDDPIVPAEIFSADSLSRAGIAGAIEHPLAGHEHRRMVTLGDEVCVLTTRGGGHAGYIGPSGSRRWLDDGLTSWFNSRLHETSSGTVSRPFFHPSGINATGPITHGQSPQDRDLTDSR